MKIKLEIDKRLEDGRRRLVAEVEAQLEKEKEGALVEARQREASIYSTVECWFISMH